MGSKVRVWTKQNANILGDLDKNGRYIVKREYIQQKMEDHAQLYFDVYNWYRKAAEEIAPVPDDAEYPIWVSLKESEKIPNSEGNVLLEIEVNEEDLITVDIEKWGRIVNYGYIPKDRADQREHDKMLSSYGTNDCSAYMSPFFPIIKKKIIKSWDRIFDESITLSPVRVGTLWELKKEWITKIEK
ncbi:MULTISPECIES: DUF3841 domain-containing protein [unclassified Sedimentibacter]|uniref:DUF3841 domain-containing protein n=1 Tax=unclassified Sedimentibacter TaxID=2649220 RepID=UPI0027E1EB2F|nr:DUF3841 domain-containing protein [Sedimentibacter sp. MB35-C1]WMJ77440.1 DUF3841 domain-containing protein [Sedimentibacter sp. MB35-C1]